MLKKIYLFLLIILVIAVFFRLWKLSEIPPGLYPDVAINGNEALESLKTKNFRVFYPENNGREGLMMWLIALSFSIFGVSIWSIKIVAATLGILTILGLFLLTKELFQKLPENGSLAIALLASFLLATSFWHTNFSRIGFRAILLPFILVFSFYFLLRGFRQKKLLDFTISGLFFGLGFYTYISFRFAILILPAIFLPFWFIYKKDGSQKKFLLHTSYFILLAFIIALPIGIYFVQHPQDFIGRAAPISIFSTENPIKELLKSLILHLGMFNFYGDPNWRHNFAGSPMLPWPLGILFLIGLFYSIYNLIKSIVLHSSELFSIFGFLIIWWLIMLLPGILTFEGIPHALRVIGVIPVVYIFVGFGAWKTYQFFERNTRRKKLLIFTSIFFLIAIGFSEFNKYFVEWGKNKEVEGAFTTRFADEGYFLTSLSDDIQKYVIVNESGVPIPWPNGIPMPAQTIMFIENIPCSCPEGYGKTKSIYLLPKDLDDIKIDSKKTVILPMKFEGELFKELSQKFPQGEIENKKDFSVYKINF